MYTPHLFLSFSDPLLFAYSIKNYLILGFLKKFICYLYLFFAFLLNSQFYNCKIVSSTSSLLLNESIMRTEEEFPRDSGVWGLFPNLWYFMKQFLQEVGLVGGLGQWGSHLRGNISILVSFFASQSP